MQDSRDSEDAEPAPCFTGIQDAEDARCTRPLNLESCIQNLESDMQKLQDAEDTEGARCIIKPDLESCILYPVPCILYLES
jgi:hypothetical protein